MGATLQPFHPSPRIFMSPPAGPVRASVIGYGYAGRTFHVPLLRATAGIELVAVCSRQTENLRHALPQVAVIADPSTLFARDDIDLVVIATPNDTHAPLAAEALRAGKHVVIDKPFALNLAEARALTALADESRRVLSVFQNRRWDSDFLAVSQAIADGEIGQVAHFESHFDRFRPQVRARWREQAGPGAGIWYDLGPHLIDQALQLFGLPSRVSGRLAIQRNGGESPDWAHVLLDYGTPQVILHASMVAAGGSARFNVHGDRGSLMKREPDQQEAQLKAGLVPGSGDWGADSDPLLLHDGLGAVREMAPARGDYLRFYAEVRDAITGDGVNPVPPIQALAVMAVLEAAIHSDQQAGSSIALPLSAGEIRAWEQSHNTRPLNA
jgi:predicted dehydrogenase